MSTPRTTALKNQNRLRELERLETIKKAELKAARKQASDAHQSAGGYGKQAKHTKALLDDYVQQQANINIAMDKIKSDHTGASMLDAVQKCDAVQDAANNFRTSKEAATAIAVQAAAIGEVYDMQAALPDGKKLQRDADQAERFSQAAKTKEIEAQRKRAALAQDVKQVTAELAELKKIMVPAQLALTNGEATAGSRLLPGFFDEDSNDGYVPLGFGGGGRGDSDVDDQDEDAAGGGEGAGVRGGADADADAAEATGATPGNGRKRRRVNSPPATEPKSATKSIPDVE